MLFSGPWEPPLAVEAPGRKPLCFLLEAKYAGPGGTNVLPGYAEWAAQND